MGATAPMALSSKVQFDGAMNHHSGITRTAFVSTAAVDNISPFVAHGPLTILKLVLNILTSTTASAKFELGNAATASAYSPPINLKNVPAGLYEIFPSSGWPQVNLQKGDFIKTKALQTGASPTAVFSGGIVFVPTSGQSDAATTG